MRCIMYVLLVDIFLVRKHEHQDILLQPLTCTPVILFIVQRYEQLFKIEVDNVNV